MRNKDKHRLKACRYLNDGVYAGFDGIMVWIWSSDGVTDLPAIAFEPGTFMAFKKYANDLVKFGLQEAMEEEQI